MLDKLMGPNTEVIFNRGVPVVIGLPLVDAYTPRRLEHRVEGPILFPRRKVGQVTGPIRNGGVK